MTEVTVLGCGTSTGVPLIHCKCKVCRSKNPKNHRLRASIWVKSQGKSILVDTSTDLRAQALANKIPRIDAVLYTHPHADHIHGIDELRSYNYVQKQSIPVYGNDWTRAELLAKFPYIFGTGKEGPPKPEGGGVPQLILNAMPSSAPRVDVCGVPVIPIALQHGSKECLGYRFDRVAYVTDCSYIPETSIQRLFGLDVLILDCVRLEPHPTHFNLDQALDLVSKIKPKKTFLTHMGHDFEYLEWKKKLPKGVHLAFDRMTVRA
ncbi:MAG: MBL fold metallo-hydrolase [Bdellovibrionales bacterium]|nr:MBL fold metallo-hydrolase [Bdellovibrionales bacterium]